MSHMHFSIVNIIASLKRKCITIECSLDADPDTVTNSSLLLLNRTTNSVELTDVYCDGRLIEITLRDWPQPKDEYMLIIQGGIKSIIGDTLEAGIIRTITFKSDVLSDVTITSPADFEEISELSFKWNETGENTVNSFYLEIARENAFYNIAYATGVTGKSEIILSDCNMENGQYYLRVRAASGENYGQWSNTVTFIYKKGPGAKTTGGTSTETEISSDVLIEANTAELTVEDTPSNGVTPEKSFVFSFSNDIDISDMKVSVYRSDFQ